MTIRDVLRVLRRRFLWFLVVFTGCFGYYLYSLTIEVTPWAVSATVQVNPMTYATIAADPFVSGRSRSTTLAAEAKILKSTPVIEEAFRRLKEVNPGASESDLTSVAIVHDSAASQLVLSSFHADKKYAVTILEKLIKAGVWFAENRANKDIEETRRLVKAKLNDAIQNESKMSQEIETVTQEAIRQFREKYKEYDKEDLRLEDIEVEYAILLGAERGTTEGIRNLESKERMLREKAKLYERESNLVALAEVQEVPLPALHKWAKEDGEIQRLQSEYRALQLERVRSLRRRTEQHPTILDLDTRMKEIAEQLGTRKREVAKERLSQDQFDALLTGDLTRLEREALQQDLSTIRRRRDLLTDSHRELVQLKQQRAGRTEAVQRLRSYDVQLLPSKQPGYLSVLEWISPEDTLEGVKERRQWCEGIEQSATQAPRRMANLAVMALLVSLIAGFVAAYSAEFLDQSIRTDHDVRRHLNYRVLGIVPSVGRDDLIDLSSQKRGSLREVFDTLATMIQAAPEKEQPKVLVLTSAAPREGKTTIALNLAVALARQGRKTLLVDGDLRVPMVHKLFNVVTEPGLTEALGAVGQEGGGPDLQPYVRGTEVENLSVIPAGRIPKRPESTLESERLRFILGAASKAFDFVVVDTPPILPIGDALKFSGAGASVLMILESGRTDRRQASWAKHLLESIRASVLGVILNKAAQPETPYYYYYYPYHYRRS